MDATCVGRPVVDTAETSALGMAAYDATSRAISGRSRAEIQARLAAMMIEIAAIESAIQGGRPAFAVARLNAIERDIAYIFGIVAAV
jgi:hypothetical protein